MTIEDAKRDVKKYKKLKKEIRDLELEIDKMREKNGDSFIGIFDYIQQECGKTGHKYAIGESGVIRCIFCCKRKMQSGGLVMPKKVEIAQECNFMNNRQNIIKYLQTDISNFPEEKKEIFKEAKVRFQKYIEFSDLKNKKVKQLESLEKELSNFENELEGIWKILDKALCHDIERQATINRIENYYNPHKDKYYED